jgi:integrase
MRAARHARGNQMFTAPALRKLVDKAGIPLKAMILVGINCGFGNGDCGTLPLSAVDLGAGWINYPRPKTAIPRRCPLWPETVKALKAAIAERPKPKNPGDDGFLFITKYGAGWAKSDSDNQISKAFRKLSSARMS